MFGLRSKSHLTRVITIAPPEAETGRQGIAIVACVKNEASYIREWVHFHRSVGVRHFYLYDDGSTDGTFSLLREILNGEELTVVPWKMRMRDDGSGELLNGQTMAFAHAILNFGGKYDRMAFIDVDEFLLPKTGRTLQEALLGAGGFPNISLPWHMFGHSGHVARPAGPICLELHDEGLGSDASASRGQQLQMHCRSGRSYQSRGTSFPDTLSRRQDRK